MSNTGALQENQESVKYSFNLTLTRRKNAPPLSEIEQIHTCKLCYPKPVNNLQLTREGKNLKKAVNTASKMFPEIDFSQMKFNPHAFQSLAVIKTQAPDLAFQLLQEAIFRIKEISGDSNWLDNIKIRIDE